MFEDATLESARTELEKKEKANYANRENRWLEMAGDFRGCFGHDGEKFVGVKLATYQVWNLLREKKKADGGKHSMNGGHRKHLREFSGFKIG